MDVLNLKKACGVSRSTQQLLFSRRLWNCLMCQNEAIVAFLRYWNVVWTRQTPLRRPNAFCIGLTERLAGYILSLKKRYLVRLFKHKA